MGHVYGCTHVSVVCMRACVCGDGVDVQCVCADGVDVKFVWGVGVDV